MDAVGFYFHQLLRTIISFIDGLIYTADAEIYNLMMKIADAQIFDSSTISEVAGRVYQLLALIMMFRLIFTFITYIINPDDIGDKTKGLGNIAKKIVITLALIIVTPWGFQQARNIQNVILSDGVIEYFVFGQDANMGTSSGYEFMYSVGKLFITPYQCNSDDCKSLYESGDPKTVDLKQKSLCQKYTWTDNVALNDGEGNLSCPSGDCNSSCGYGVGSDQAYSNALADAVTPNGARYNLQALTSLAKYGKNGNGWDSDFYVDYRYPLIGTTLIGFFIGYMLIGMCIDIAIRSVKLAFYEIISPIPIISNLGTKNGKDSMLSKWFTQVSKTYLDLFIRVAGLQLSIFFIDVMLDNFSKESVGGIRVSGAGTGMTDGDTFIQLFLVIGALSFAKSLPDILKNLGINLDTGSFSLKKKLEPAQSLMRPITGAAAGMIGGAISSAQASAQLAEEGKSNAIKAGFAAMRGSVSGAMIGAKAGMKQKEGLGLSAGFGASGRVGQSMIRNAGTSSSERFVAGIQQRLGMDTKADTMEKHAKKYEEWKKNHDAMLDYAKKKAAENPSLVAEGVKYTDADGQEQTADVNLAQARTRLTTLQGQGDLTGTARQQLASVTARRNQGFNNSTYETARASVNAQNPGVRNRVDIERDQTQLERDRTAGFNASVFETRRQAEENNFNISSFENRRATLEGERTTLTQNLQQQQQQLNQRLSDGFRVDNDVRHTVSFTDANGNTVTGDYSINELRAMRSSSPFTTQAGIDSAISSLTREQRRNFDNETQEMRNNINTTQASLNRVDTDMSQTDQEMQDYRQQHAARLQAIADEQRAAEEQYNADLEARAQALQSERDRRDAVDSQLAEITRQETVARTQWNNALAAEETAANEMLANARDREKEIINLQAQIASAEDEIGYQYLDHNLRDEHNKINPTIAAYYEQLNRSASEAGLASSSNSADLKKVKSQVKSDTTRFSDEYAHAMNVKEASKPDRGGHGHKG